MVLKHLALAKQQEQALKNNDLDLWVKIMDQRLEMVNQSPPELDEVGLIELQNIDDEAMMFWQTERADVGKSLSSLRSSKKYIKYEQNKSSKARWIDKTS